MKRETLSEKETVALASDFMSSLAREGEGAVVVGLYGDLGSGKTTFMKGIAEHLGVPETITSPTFVIMKIYKLRRKVGVPTKASELQAKSYKLLVHIDAYRLEKGEELNRLGFGEILKDPKNLIFVEWPENVRSAMPENHKKIFFKFVNDKMREIIL